MWQPAFLRKNERKKEREREREGERKREGGRREGREKREGGRIPKFHWFHRANIYFSLHAKSTVSQKTFQDGDLHGFTQKSCGACISKHSSTITVAEEESGGRSCVTI